MKMEAVSDVQPATQEMEVSLNSSALCSDLPPPISPSRMWNMSQNQRFPAKVFN